MSTSDDAIDAVLGEQVAPLQALEVALALLKRCEAGLRADAGQLETLAQAAAAMRAADAAQHEAAVIALRARARCGAITAALPTKQLPLLNTEGS